jgi:hypothetical protein
MFQTYNEETSQLVSTVQIILSFPQELRAVRFPSMKVNIVHKSTTSLNHIQNRVNFMQKLKYYALKNMRARERERAKKGLQRLQYLHVYNVQHYSC